MKSVRLRSRTRADIDVQVGKILRDLSAEPPIRLEHVRDILSLDLEWYSSADTGLMGEILHKLKFGGRMIRDRPQRIGEAFKTFKFHSLLAYDQRRIIIDGDLHPKKQRFAEAHEVLHDVLDWHERCSHGDDSHMLSASCHEREEAEANYGAGRLLYLQDRFTVEARDRKRNIWTVLQLGSVFDNSVTSALWGYVEEVEPDWPMVAIISHDPHHLPDGVDPKGAVRHCIESDAFSQRFGDQSEEALFGVVSGYVKAREKDKAHYRGEGVTRLTDMAGGVHEFCFQSFWNGWDLLTLGVYVRPVPTVISVPGF